MKVDVSSFCFTILTVCRDWGIFYPMIVCDRLLPERAANYAKRRYKDCRSHRVSRAMRHSQVSQLRMSMFCFGIAAGKKRARHSLFR
jgi:hypothetical protein